MPSIDHHPPGQFCWAELATDNMKGSAAFYQRVLGWSVKEIPMGPEFGSYYIFQVNGDDAAAGYQLMLAQREQGVKPHWLLYVAVTEVDAAIAHAKQLGGTLLLGPHDVPGAGRMAILRDPQGAAFAIWQAREHIGSRTMATHGRHCWSELAATDTDAATKFYTALFGWSTHVQDMGHMKYTTWICEAGPTGGMLPAAHLGPNCPPHWTAYFSVDDCDAAAAAIPQAGGNIIVPPTDIPQVGRFLVAHDSQGAVVNLIQLAPCGS